MLKTIEARIEPDGHITLAEEVKVTTSTRVLVTFLSDVSLEQDGSDEVTLASEASLAEDWLRPEEDEAWSYLQKPERL